MSVCMRKNDVVWKVCTQCEGQRGRRGMSQRRSCDTELTICSLPWLGPVANEELEEEVARDHVYVI